MTATAGKTYPMAGPWEGARSCTGRVAPGAAALLAWLLANRPAPPERSMGIYNCRTVVGGSTTSLHGEGRAVDWGVFPLEDGKGSAAGHELVDLLLTHADTLGIQCVIYDRTIWSARSPAGRRYTGVHPHYDHLHIELQWAAARGLTLNRLVEVLGGSAERPETVPPPEQETPKPPPPVEPAPTPAPSWTETLVDNLPTVRRRANLSSANQWDRRVQGLLAAAGVLPIAANMRGGQFDGRFGPSTDRAVRQFQRQAGIAVDGIVGRQTWTKLLGR